MNGFDEIDATFYQENRAAAVQGLLDAVKTFDAGGLSLTGDALVDLARRVPDFIIKDALARLLQDYRDAATFTEQGTARCFIGILRTACAAAGRDVPPDPTRGLRGEGLGTEATGEAKAPDTPALPGVAYYAALDFLKASAQATPYGKRTREVMEHLDGLGLWKGALMFGNVDASKMNYTRTILETLETSGFIIAGHLEWNPRFLFWSVRPQRINAKGQD